MKHALGTPLEDAVKADTADNGLAPFPFDPAQSPDEDVWNKDNCWTDWPYRELDVLTFSVVNEYGFVQNLGPFYEFICHRCGKRQPCWGNFCEGSCSDSADRKLAAKVADHITHGVQVKVEMSNFPNGRKLIGYIRQGEGPQALCVLNENWEMLSNRILNEIVEYQEEHVDYNGLCDGGGVVEVYWEDE